MIRRSQGVALCLASGGRDATHNDKLGKEGIPLRSLVGAWGVHRTFELGDSSRSLLQASLRDAPGTVR